MKQITIILIVSILTISNGFGQNEKTKHFEIDVMAGMHNYSSSFFHAINSVTWYHNPDGNMSRFSGYGTSMMPAFNVSYFFNNDIGISIGYSPINAQHSLYIKGTGNFYNKAEQNNISIGVTGRISSKEKPISLNFGTGFIIAPFEINKHLEVNPGGFYLDGSSTGAGLYGMASFQIRILSFLQFKTGFNYSFIPADINLYDSGQDIEENIENLNIGGFTIKTGLSITF